MQLTFVEQYFLSLEFHSERKNRKFYRLRFLLLFGLNPVFCHLIIFIFVSFTLSLKSPPKRDRKSFCRESAIERESEREQEREREREDKITYKTYKTIQCQAVSIMQIERILHQCVQWHSFAAIKIDTYLCCVWHSESFVRFGPSIHAFVLHFICEISHLTMR